MGVSELHESSLLLDEKLLGFMDQLELLEEKRSALNSLIEQGWFSMSKARYSMGNKQVSALQHANEMEPLVRVKARILENGEMEFCTERDSQNSCDKFRTDATPVEDIGPKEKAVRRRIQSKKDITEKTESKEPENERDAPAVQKRDQNPQQDPIKWFGILVPQSLKQAQSSFKQVIELSAEVASLQAAVLKTRQELKHLLQKRAPAAAE